VKTTRKPFVEPKLKEEASLQDVTLITGGQPTYRLHFRRRRHRHGNHHNHGGHGT
jgi:hypothetical protein